MLTPSGFSMHLLFATLATLLNISAIAQQRPAVPDPCALLSRAEIEEAIDTSIGEGVSRVQTGTTATCWFTRTGGGSVAVLIRHVPQPNWTEDQIHRMRGGAPAFRELAGLGDRSFIYDMKETGAAVCIFRGDYYVQIWAFRTGEASKIFPAVENLARKVLARF